jgi:hypothetical protein
MRKLVIWFGLMAAVLMLQTMAQAQTVPEGLQRRRSQALPRCAGPGRYGGAGLSSAAATQTDTQMPGGATEAWAVIQRFRATTWRRWDWARQRSGHEASTAGALALGAAVNAQMELGIAGDP